jgi:Fe-S oxidoreductase
MNALQIKTNIEDCFRNDSPICTDICPFHLDVRSFMDKLQKGSFDAAFKVFRNAVVFPDIVARICDEPCKKACVRNRTDEGVSLRMLERASIEWAKNINPVDFNVPLKHKKIAIIGAGISGLCCALKLASKKYEVTVYEKCGRIGGNLWNVLPEDIFMADINRQFQYEKYILKLNTAIKTLDEITSDAIYVATGAGGEHFGLIDDMRRDSLGSTREGVFLGGELLGAPLISAIENGIRAAQSIERYLKVGIMNTGTGEDATPTTHFKDENFEFEPTEAVLPENGTNYSGAEAQAEAGRCIKCDCDACIRRCDLMKHFKCIPVQIKEWSEGSFQKDSYVSVGRAKRLVNACNMCGTCKNACPENVDVGDYLLQVRRKMHQEGILPPVFHDFWIRDMLFANSEKASIALGPKGFNTSKYMFFPGCQLGASDDRYVSETYRYLLSKKNDTALMLCCCGAPADWGGDFELHAKWMETLTSEWHKLGAPITIFACPTCKEMLKKYIPSMQGVSLYELMLEWGLPDKNKALAEKVSVFDPCTSKYDPQMQQSVRDVLKNAGLALEELSFSKGKAQCCSWGGHINIANPEYVKEIARDRVNQSRNTYITYCTNCRDTFADAGKESFHILDLIFNLNEPKRKSSSISQRRENRINLKTRLMKEMWGEIVSLDTGKSKIKLFISPELSAKMDDALILEEEITKTVEFCEQTGRKIIDVKTGNFIGHLMIGIVTLWTEYRAKDDGYELINAYSHRLQILE